MVENGIAEVAGIRMTGGTSACPMVRRSAVASRTILIANRGVIKNGVGKVTGIRMTSGTGTRPVVGWRRVTARAILRADGVVVENGVGEVVRVAVTGRTSTRKVIFGWRVAVGTILVAHQSVVEGNGRPLRHTMASCTIRAKLAFMRFVFSMTTHTIDGRAFISAARMAIATFQIVMAAGQREEIVL